MHIKLIERYRDARGIKTVLYFFMCGTTHIGSVSWVAEHAYAIVDRRAFKALRTLIRAFIYICKCGYLTANVSHCFIYRR